MNESETEVFVEQPRLHRVCLKVYYVLFETDADDTIGQIQWI